MTQAASRMFHRPSKVVMCRDFMKKLPYEFVENLMRARVINIEFTPIEIILVYARGRVR
jgi:hypothetical protein